MNVTGKKPSHLTINASWTEGLSGGLTSQRNGSSGWLANTIVAVACVLRPAGGGADSRVAPTKASSWHVDNGAGTQQPPLRWDAVTMALILQHHSRKSLCWPKVRKKNSCESFHVVCPTDRRVTFPSGYILVWNNKKPWMMSWWRNAQYIFQLNILYHHAKRETKWKIYAQMYFFLNMNI